MIRIFITIIGFLMFFGQTLAQSTAFVINVGPSAGLQKWDNASGREPLFQYHASVAIETINNENDRGSLLFQFGYHVKGSANRYRFNTLSGFPGSNVTERFIFNNLSLVLGAKQRFDMGSSGKVRYFYFGGLRGDYTVSNNLQKLKERNAGCYPAAYPLPGGVQEWIFGFSAGGGLEFKFSELIGGQLQLSINPDVTPQYRQLAIPNVIDLCFNGPNISIPERRIRNTTVEVSLGIRLLRKVVLVD